MKVDNRSEPVIALTMTHDLSTTATHRFQADGERALAMVQTLYIMRKAFGDRTPKRVKIMIQVTDWQGEE